LDPTSRPGVVSYILVASMTVWIGCFAIGFGVVVPQFASLFAGFGADLPRLTQFVLSARIPIWALLLLACLMQLGLLIYLVSARTFAARRLTLITSGLNIAGQLVLVVAMYAPIFKLGAVV
jgi:type II secretory pathway component PulF